MTDEEVRIFSTSDEGKIFDLLDELSISDIYFSPKYVKLFEKHQSEKAVYFYYRSNEGFVLYPFFLRPIMKYPGYSDFYDISSTWYFGGPLSQGISSKEDVDKFDMAFHGYCLDNHIVSEFIRFHPLIKNYNLVDDSSLLKKKWDVVYVDLSKSDEVISGEYDRKCRNAIRKAAKQGITVEVSDSDASCKDFIALYIDSMVKKGVDKYYIFNDDFFSTLFNDLKNKFMIFHAKLGDSIISSDLILYNNYFSTSYLRAYNPDYKSVISPNNLLVDEQIMWSKKRGCKYFFLGGGHLGNDSLFKFKASFSKTITDFFVYERVHNPGIYRELEDIYRRNNSSESSDYFPIYRK